MEDGVDLDQLALELPGKSAMKVLDVELEVEGSVGKISDELCSKAPPCMLSMYFLDEGQTSMSRREQY